MTTTVRLRRWQRRALERLDEADSRDFLAVATPGAGKTTFALVALRRRMVDHPGRRVVVVAPTAHLKTQWAAAARSMGLVLEDAWRPTDGSLPGDIHGIVTTYQQVATSTNALARLSERGLVVLDEIHHAGDDRAWGQAVREAFTDAAWRLALSGTPFRSDSHAIPFVRYGLDEALPDFEYGYGDALADANVVRQVEFPALDGEMEWIDNEGVDRVASFADPLAPALAAQRLRTALSVDGRWLPAVIAAAHERLGTIRTSQPDAGGLVIATDQDHAKAIAASMQRTHGIAPAIATSDDARASAKIARFAASEEPWLVAVRMVSEGVDIPRLTVGVFATTTTTELFFRQAVGRFVRARRGETATVAALFVPPDRRLQSHAAEITRVRRHHLVTTAHRRVVEGELDDIAEDRTEQMSLFAPVSATPVGGVAELSRQIAATSGEALDPDDDALLIELPPLPTAVSASTDHATEHASGSPGSRRRRLRTLNAARAADLVHHANLSHASVNAELNRLAGITKITEATEVQLERRLAAAEKWLHR